MSLNVAEVIALDTDYHDPEEIHACDRHFQCTITVSLNVAEVIALDTEYHDPEEIHACAPRLFQTSSSPQLPDPPPDPAPSRAATVIIRTDDEVASISASRPQVWRRRWNMEFRRVN